MERKENLCQPPEYPAEMFSEYFESAKERALRASEIEAILGDDYDLDHLRELVEADRDGRCVVLPKRIQCRAWKNRVISTEKFAWILKRLGKSFFPTFEAAEAALKKEQEIGLQNLSPEAQKLYNDILTGECLKGENNADA